MNSSDRVLSITRTTSTAHRLSHYDGACGNVHGHNLTWDVDITVQMNDDDDTNMPVDFKDISDTIDTVDHAIVVNNTDMITAYKDMFGDIVTVDGDPTSELMASYMAQKIFGLSTDIKNVHVELIETEKYSVTAQHP